MRHTELFLLRLWTEQENNGSTQWCGKLQQPVSGEVHYFRTLPALTELLLSMVPSKLPRHSEDEEAGEEDE